ncbi:metallophosphoesterase [Jeotgalibacillus proteolyticus]|uniref:Metallophosphoesterase n=1 Tax=Jeotgalibacillus proteolyticus TaxID=2082395 RepID=A0A2S5GEE9_9BACL|nr:metallophosphoesterase [Jeotgalibacillus proteolyticus]PPA71285.1 metallophosphoesterase [Jeotgalibacillus proteolyticus]
MLKAVFEQAEQVEKKMKKLAGLFLLGITFGAYMVKRAFENNIDYKTLELEHYSFKKKSTIFFISDVHRRVLSDRFIAAIPSADAVIIGGDLVEKGMPLSRVEENLKQLSQKGPLYFVYGNNDEEVDRIKLNEIFDRCHVTVLENSAVKLKEEDGHPLWLAGIGDASSEKDDVALALSYVNCHDPIILISHDPRGVIEEIPKDRKVILILSGHTHGGQIRIFGMGPYELGGLKKSGSTIHLISNGYGTSAFPIRLGAAPETHFITLKNLNNR